jgi:hypothetical protein
MNELPSKQFRTTFHRLTEPTVVTALGRPIGTYIPVDDTTTRGRQTPVPVSGIWLRSRIEPPRLEVLAEINGEWRLAIREVNDDTNHISHIVEPLGMRSSPLDDLSRSR